MQYFELQDKYEAFNKYMIEGGMAGSYLYKDQEARYDYIAEVFDTLIVRDIRKKYKIRSRTQLREWVMWYNGHTERHKLSSAKGEIYMTKGRKTTQEERVKIVAYCIEHGKDYRLTAETYEVSYQQIYSWVKKYEEKGVEGLTDRRGKAKPESELSEAEILRQENRILQAKIKDQEMEIALLKKLRELRGGGW